MKKFLIIIIATLIATGFYFLKKDNKEKEFVSYKDSVSGSYSYQTPTQITITSAINPTPTITNKEEPTGQATEAIGYIKTVYDKNGKNYLDIDYVQWLSGKEAIKAAIEDKKCFTEEKNTTQILNELGNFDISAGFGKFANCAPNGYYIRNQNPKIRTFAISENTEIAMQTYASGQCHVQWNEKVSYMTFKSFWENNPACSHLKRLLYNIEIKNDIITKIIERYIP